MLFTNEKKVCAEFLGLYKKSKATWFWLNIFSYIYLEKELYTIIIICRQSNLNTYIFTFFLLFFDFLIPFSLIFLIINKYISIAHYIIPIRIILHSNNNKTAYNLFNIFIRYKYAIQFSFKRNCSHKFGIKKFNWSIFCFVSIISLHIISRKNYQSRCFLSNFFNW